MTPVSKYRMLVQVRTDLTKEEIAKYEASKGANGNSPSIWPFRDTGEIIHARRARTAAAFYRALRQIQPINKVRAVKVNGLRPGRNNSVEAFRAWRGFDCMQGTINGVSDEVKHFEVSHGLSACGLPFTTYSRTSGKPECDKCLAAAIDKHPEMGKYL